MCHWQLIVGIVEAILLVHPPFFSRSGSSLGYCARDVLSLAVLIIGSLLVHTETLFAQDSAPVQVVSPVEAVTAPQRAFSGTITSQRRASLSPRISGLVKTADADIGFGVRQGDLLVALDTTLAQFGLRQASDRLNEARLQLGEFERLQKEGVSLLSKRAMSATEVQNRNAQARIQAAVVSRLETEYALFKERVARHNVVAPFNGVVVAKLAEVGEWVETGVPVVELIDPDHLRLDVQVPQEHYSALDINQAVSVVTDANSGFTVAGEIVAKAPLSDRSARTFLVRVKIQNHQNQLIPGMSARAIFSFPVEGRALTLSRDTLIRYPDGTTSVWLVVEEQGQLKAREKKVSVTSAQGANVRVDKGLSEQDRVVIRGNEILREGQSVHLVPTPVSDPLPTAQGK
jgi:membrane fusion protein, multidrug efflux system